MSESSHSHQPPTSRSHTSLTNRSPSMVRLGGAMNIAACLIGLGIFAMACGGFSAAMVFSLLPLILSIIGFVLTIIGGVQEIDTIEDTHVLASLFIGAMGIIGSLVVMSAWLGWKVFP